MKFKNLKKSIKQQLFNINFYTNSFIIFEIRLFDVDLTLLEVNWTKESFSKQVFNKLKMFEFKNIKFPNKVKFINSLSDFIRYLYLLIEKKNIYNVCLIKIHFVTITKNIKMLIDIFVNEKIFYIFSILFFLFVKKKVLVQTLTNLSFPFIKV